MKIDKLFSIVCIGVWCVIVVLLIAIEIFT